MRLPSLATCLCLACAVSPVAAQADTEKWIAVFDYRGAGPDTGATQTFDAFIGLIESKVSNIQDRIAEALLTESQRAAELDYIFDVKIRRESAASMSRTEISDWLANQDDVLQAYLGSIVPSSDGTYELVTRSYQIETNSPNGLRAFNLTTELSSEEYRSVRDSHSLIILYALVREAIDNDVPREQVAIIIGDAMNHVADLAGGSPGENADLDRIRRAWTDLRDEL